MNPCVQVSEKGDDKEVIFTVRNPQGGVDGEICLLKFHDASYGFANLKIESSADYVGTLRLLLQAGIANAKRRQGARIGFRLDESKHQVEQETAMRENGFVFVTRRIEFRADISSLALDSNSPISWKSLPDLSEESLRYAGAVLDQASTGDPAKTEVDNAQEFLRCVLNENNLTSGPDCVQIGSMNNVPCAIVVAQVNPCTGWSRITYIGVVPQFRGQGISKWVHRHGFAMMKAQGGTLYHGGTDASNIAMIRLFEQHGCKVYRSMQVWDLKI
ncbi:MAG: GNAT family N-acetyltransferase [Oligoflexales bacterium]